MVGQTISHYRVLEKLGQGGMGVVYKAENLKLKRTVALKFLPESLSTDPHALERFQREAQAASSLSHANICTIYDVDESGGRLFIAMEYLQGRTLRENAMGKPLAVDQILDLGIQIAGALDAAHSKGIIHRDIKPANIMLAETPTGSECAKLLDFGLAKPALDPRKLTRTAAAALPTIACSEDLVTSPGSTVGTVAYMSPEQARGGALDARTDIFSFGVVLYEMATGALPFQGSTAAVVFEALLDKSPTPPLRQNSALPPELDRIIMKTLEKDRDRRYQSARELLVDLRNLKRDSESGPAAVAPVRSSQRRWWFTTTAVVFLAGLSAAGYYYYSRGQPIDSLAVLPLVNSSADPNAEYLGEGIAESLINKLSQTPHLRVTARSTAFRYKGRDVDPQKAGRDLKVRAVLSGRIAQRGDNLSVQVDLIDVEDGSQIWGQQYNRKLADIFAVQEDIALEIAEKLRLKLTGQDREKLIKRDTQNAKAFEDYVKGRYYWNRRTPESIPKSVSYFEQAIAKDPQYALGYAGLADAYVLLAFYSGAPPLASYLSAKAAAEKALTLDASVAEAHVSLAYLVQRTDFDWTRSEREYQTAIQMNANYPTAHHWYALFLASQGRFEQAFTEAARARELDPLSLIINSLQGRLSVLARRYPQAIEGYRRTLEMDPAFFPSQREIGMAYVQTKQYQQAITELRKAVSMAPDDSLALGQLGQAYALAGQKNDAFLILEKLKARSRQGYVSGYDLAAVATGLGDYPQALSGLEKAYTDHAEWLTNAKVEPWMDPLRSQPRFRDLLRKMNLEP